MIVFIPGNTQSIECTPRYTGVINYDVEIYNEDTREITKILSEDLTVFMPNFPLIRFSFNYTCTENQTFSIKLLESENNRILWRGKAFATSQDSQNYRINV